MKLKYRGIPVLGQTLSQQKTNILNITEAYLCLAVAYNNYGFFFSVVETLN